MKTKLSVMVLWSGTACIFFLIVLLNQYALLGTALGYWSGFLNTEWLRKDVTRSIDLDVLKAQNQMRRGFLARLGLITLAVTLVARFKFAWLSYFMVGLALGIFISIVLAIISQLRVERGDK